MLFSAYMWLVIGLMTLFFGVGVVACLPLTRHDRYYAWFQGNWGRMIVRLSRIPFTVEGLDRLDPARPYVFMANHQSYFDVFCLSAALPHAFKYVAKRELLFLPFFGQVLWATRHVIVDRGRHAAAVAAMQRAADRIRNGSSILVFPEGTRSRDGRIGPFKKGGFLLARAAGVEIVPVGIAGTGSVMPPGAFRFRRGAVRLTVGEPVRADSGESIEELIERVRAEIAGRSGQEFKL